MNELSDMTPILITGAHRTGTTWVGKVLAHDPRIGYVSEPLHLKHSHGVLDKPVDAWYQYICDENGDQFYSAYQKTIQFKYQLWKAIQNIDGFKSAGKILLDQVSFLMNRIQSRRVLLKDPFAVFSVPWFLDRLNAQVVIMVRHPLPFISSLQRLDWHFDFKNLLQQQLLMRDYLEPFREEMVQTNQQKEDIIGQGILLWRMIYYIVDLYRTQDHNIMVVRHEDISRRPGNLFSEISDYLGIGQSEIINQAALRSSQVTNPPEVSKKDEHAVYLDSRTNLGNWKKRLDHNDVDRILSGTKDIADRFYKPREWEEW